MRTTPSSSPRARAPADEGPEALSLLLDDGRRVRCKLAIAADGAMSRLRDMAGIVVDVHEFRQYAVVATVRTPDGHHETAWQRFLHNGPLAFLPVSPTACSIVWSTTEQESQELLELESDAFCERLYAASEGRLGSLKCLPERARFPLRSQHARSYLAERLVLAGDAAHRHHRQLHRLDDPRREQHNNLSAVNLLAARQYVDSLAQPDGGFCGGSWDDTADVEYTFYGLATLALLAELES